ncbi:MAG: lysophospholipid acyltransferase family protein [Candidatus Binataceae bacterium]
MDGTEVTGAELRDTRAIGSAPDSAPDDPYNPALLDNIGLPRARPITPSGPKMDIASYLLFGVTAAVLHLVSLLPDFVLYPGAMFGTLLSLHFDKRHTRIGVANLKIAFPEKTDAERWRILRASYLNLGRCAAEYIRLAGFFRHRLARRTRYATMFDLEGFLPAYRRQGILILSAHFGNFELLAPVHAMHGYQVSLVHRTQRILFADKLLTYVRERAGVQVIRKYRAARAVIRALDNGELVGIPFDQNAKRREAVYAPFFGELAATSSGLARLAASSRAHVLPVFIVREGDGRHHRIEIHDPIEVQRTSDPQADIVENTRRFVNAVEGIARRYPEQFLWTHRRYRTRPPGARAIYDWEIQKSRRRKA